MKPVYIDFHIHTSANPDNLNSSYDVDSLVASIENIADGSEYLIGFSDHNTINKVAYIEAKKKIENLLVCVELHVRNYRDAKPYHCHIIFDLADITDFVIDDLNSKLDELYPNKVVKNTDESIPTLEQITNIFDSYEFLLLPHGGQNHATFDVSIPCGVKFDKTLERSIYYNHFDGFTARSNKGLTTTNTYFERLGIKDFVNLVTTTDNYKPNEYPDCKGSREASEFVPTWMLASPTFNGLRLSLSESSRLVYGTKPDNWAECIRDVKLQNANIDIVVTLTPGLNVVIGGSSSGKSLFVDSISSNITGNFDECVYADTEYSVSDIQVNNPTGQHPYYFDQNYISKICDPKDRENSLGDISILQRIFPSDSSERATISNGLKELGEHLHKLVEAVKTIEQLHDSLARISKLSHLIVTEVVHGNPIRQLKPSESLIEKIDYLKPSLENDFKKIDSIEKYLSENPLIEHDKYLTTALKEELRLAYEYSIFETAVREVISDHEVEVDNAQQKDNKEVTTKRQQFETLLDSIVSYSKAINAFENAVGEISKFKIEITTKKIVSMGHTLFIDNAFELTPGKFIEVLNEMLKTPNAISTFEALIPESLFSDKLRKKSPKVTDLSDLESRVKNRFEQLNDKKYRITTKAGKDFEALSPGWKTSVILDLLLGWEDDNAPLIIDQPEDNLATNYINGGLLEAIKSCKSAKQIILVSHNATIPMLGDAQNVVVCTNQGNKIVIRSNPLEGSIDDESMVDLVARITDGGKASIKKRVKKYNLKNYRESDEAAIQ